MKTMLESSTPLQPMGFMLVVFQLITAGNIQDDKPVHVECHEGKVRTGVLTYSESAYADFLERAQHAGSLADWEDSPAFMVSYRICYIFCAILTCIPTVSTAGRACAARFPS